MENRISFEFNARYEVLGQPGPEISKVWFVCHGHGQLAKYFIKKFESINDGKTLIVAPEGLFRYYLQGFTGRVGATWMTKEDRISDIDNYLRYLVAVYKSVTSQLSKKVSITLLGFSQGAATISRFATQTPINFDQLILWAGIFPPDLPPLESQKKLSDKKCTLVYGTKDPYLTESRIKEQEEIANQINILPQIITFEGEHELSELIIENIHKDNYLQS